MNERYSHIRTVSFFLLFVLFFSAPNISHASLAQADVSVKVTPDTPRANESVSIEIVSYVTDLNRADITWLVNGKAALAGTGQRKFSFTAGPVGSQTRIDISIVTPNFEALQKTIVIAPADLDILIESADGYVPPFYKGRPLPVKEGAIRVVAMPFIQTASGRYLTPNDFTYTWSRNDTKAQDASGFAKNEFVFYQSYLNTDENIDVTASGVRDQFAAESKFAVKLFAPKIVFYENDPLRGVRYDHALRGNVTIESGTPKTIVAVPYFFGAKTPSDRLLTYAWSLNNQDVPTPSSKNALSLQAGNQKGTSTLSLKIEQLVKLFQEGSATLSIILK